MEEAETGGSLGVAGQESFRLSEKACPKEYGGLKKTSDLDIYVHIHTHMRERERGGEKTERRRAQ